MKQIRRGTFETNSSSVHSICIANDDNFELPESIHFELSEYGWETGQHPLKDYLYTALVELGFDYKSGSTKKIDDAIEKIKSILEGKGIKCTFEDLKFYTDKWGTWIKNEYGIDHSWGTQDFINAVLENEDLLLKALFNQNSAVYTGNDNCDREDYPMCWVAEDYFYKYNEAEESWVEVPNPIHDEENYVYFFKGN